MSDDPDSSNSRTLALLTPRRLVKAVKSLLEARGIWGKRIEPITRAVDVGGSGLGVGEEMYLVYSSLSCPGRALMNGCSDGDGDDDVEKVGGGGIPNLNNVRPAAVGVGVGVGVEAGVEVDVDVDVDGEEVRQLCAGLRELGWEGHVRAEWVGNRAGDVVMPPAVVVGSHHHQLASSPTLSSSSTASTTAASTTTRLRQAVQTFLNTHPPAIATTDTTNQSDSSSFSTDVAELLLGSVPKRWSYYPPLILLPQSAFSSVHWKQYLASLSEPARAEFYTTFTKSIHSTATNLAINAPIPPISNGTDLTRTIDRLSLNDLPTPPSSSSSSSPSTANITRSPLHLIPLHGSFGPPPPALPTPSTLSSTLFVSTTQLSIYQTWSPLHTMFSRGNISEKSRILSETFPGAIAIPGSIVVDLYAGIGYFTFCYLRAGARCVLAWELNPWSVEGLERGCGPEGNKFGSVVVVKEGEPTPDIDLHGENAPRVVVFIEDNKYAWSRLKDFREMRRRRGEEEEESLWGLGVSHVNLGLLPTSQGGWKTAVDALTDGAGGMGWAHVHENVAVEDVEEKGKEVLREFRRLVTEVSGEGGGGVELAQEPFRVKNYAPGVVHVVYDVKVWR